MTDQYRITIVVPCYKRPARTRRIINNILSQNINNWEAFVIGDGCDLFDSLFESGESEFYQKIAEQNQNKLHLFNLEQNFGSNGYHILNYGIKHALGKYLVFAGNDDIIKPNHFENYLSEIENTDFDLVYYKTCVEAKNTVRDPILMMNYIGHSEIIVRTDFVRDIEHTTVYAHDWFFINEMLSKGAKHKKASSDVITYFVRSVLGKRDVDKID